MCAQGDSTAGLGVATGGLVAEATGLIAGQTAARDGAGFLLGR